MSALLRPPHRSSVRGSSRFAAALLGVIAVGLTLAVAELLARLAAFAEYLDPASSPFDSLGAGFIAITPEWLKNVGIALFGQSDKAALAVVMVITLLAVGAGLGLLARTRRAVACWVAAALAAVVAVAILTRVGAGIADLVPLALGTWCGIAYLRRAFDDDGHAVADEPVRGDDAPSGGRRRLLRIAGLGAVGAVVAGAASRLVPASVDVQAEREAVRLPPVEPAATTPAGPSSVAAGPTGSTTAGAASGAAAPPATPRTIVLPPALPYGANPDVADLSPFVTDADSFYRVDTAFVLPRVATDGWSLTVHGLVDHPFELGWAELLAMPQIERWITLACVSNEVGGDLVGNAAWQGVRVADLLARAAPQAGADCVYSTSADGFTVTTPLDVLTDGRDAMVAIGMNGAPLPVEHGFPARLVVPGLYGYVSATKWVVDLEVTRFADATAFWTERGWAPRAPVKTASRIDTPHYGVTMKPGVVPVAGVAWAQHRGISAVQVRVDDGTWQDAELSPAASVDTWVQWVYRWDTSSLAPGSHRLTCRAIDGTGAVQDATPRPVVPDGATGYHSVPVVTS